MIEKLIERFRRYIVRQVASHIITRINLIGTTAELWSYESTIDDFNALFDGYVSDDYLDMQVGELMSVLYKRNKDLATLKYKAV